MNTCTECTHSRVIGHTTLHLHCFRLNEAVNPNDAACRDFRKRGEYHVSGPRREYSVTGQRKESERWQDAPIVKEKPLAWMS